METARKNPKGGAQAKRWVTLVPYMNWVDTMYWKSLFTNKGIPCYTLQLEKTCTPSHHLDKAGHPASSKLLSHLPLFQTLKEHYYMLYNISTIYFSKTSKIPVGILETICCWSCYSAQKTMIKPDMTLAVERRFLIQLWNDRATAEEQLIIGYMFRSLSEVMLEHRNTNTGDSGLVSLSSFIPTFWIASVQFSAILKGKTKAEVKKKEK